jgi:hypothetical protein
VEIVASASIRGGRLRVVDPGRLAARVATWPDCEADLLLVRREAVRSREQNAWYWGVILEGIHRAIRARSGYSRAELHEFFKARFNAREVVIVDAAGVICGEAIIGASTRRLTRIAFSEYCEQIRQWAAETLDLDLPDPDPAWRVSPPPATETRH